MRSFRAGAAGDLWNKWWNDLSTSWFKVETLQDYSAIDTGPSLEAWLKGDKQRARQLIKSDTESQQWAKDATNNPAQKIRLHIVQTPYTPYLEWEIEVYKLSNIPIAREEVYLVPQDKTAGLDIPSGDFMIFDSRRVRCNHYGPKGKFLGSDYYDEAWGDDISRYHHLWAELLKHKQPI